MEENVLFLIVIYIVDIVLYLISFAWMIMCNKLTCKCVSDIKRNIIRVFLIFLSLLLVFLSLYTIFPVFNTNVTEYIKYFVMVSQLIYIIVVFTFLREIIKKRCECNMNNTTEKNYNNVDIGIITFFFFVIIYITLFKLFF